MFSDKECNEDEIFETKMMTKFSSDIRKTPLGLDDKELIRGFLRHQVLACGSYRRHWKWVNE